jgi:hypothetical protein
VEHLRASWSELLALQYDVNTQLSALLSLTGKFGNYYLEEYFSYHSDMNIAIFGKSFNFNLTKAHMAHGCFSYQNCFKLNLACFWHLGHFSKVGRASSVWLA